MWRVRLSAVWIWWWIWSGAAQQDTSALARPLRPADTLTLEELAAVVHDADTLRRTDSLWYESFLIPPLPDTLAAGDSLPPFDREKFKRQIEALNARSPIEIVYHPALESTVRRMLKNKKRLERLFGLAEYYYYPMFEKELDRQNVPLELKHLPVIESALNPLAVSPAGAAGLWQFMYFTGKKYGLEMTSYLDERFSPDRSTRAAVSHLRDLYELFKDWNLVLAAYNSGAGNVTRAIRRSGGYKNYWNLRLYLPRETAGYVPNFLATWFLYEYRDAYGIKPRPPAFRYVLTDTIHIKKHVSFAQIAKVFPVTEEELSFLNPEYKLNIVPYVPSKQYTIRLPYRAAQLFAKYENDFYAAVEKEWQKKEKPLPKFYTLPNYVIYTVKPGDYLGKIARRYRTSVAKIKKWNRLKSSRIRVGQKLKIYTRHYVPATAKTTPSKSSAPPKGKYFYHTIRQGDTLWDISRKYNVSVRDLMRWNKVSPGKLKPGTKLKIYKS
ncbi:MAG: LysM peptidoglycan-binding domain-containing protein [Chlorobi bacterium]|nr:LysM peptidoglycan-binding domain-containing protein [Chlorobiota bacterium]